MGAHEGSTHPDGDEWGWACRCGDNGTGFPTRGQAEDSLRIHLAADVDADGRGPVDRLAVFVDLYHPSSYAGGLLRRALRIARGVEPVPTAQELTDEERAAAAPIYANRPAQ